MATRQSNEFGLQLGHMPVLNIRLDFNSVLALFRSERFREQFRGYQGQPVPVRTHYFTWHGRAEVLLTYLLRDSIVSLESAVSGAVFAEALTRGLMKEESSRNKILEATKDPFSLKGRGTAHLVFNALPSLIDAEYSLRARDPALWERTRVFYKEVRNPIAHAYEIRNSDPDPVWHALEFIWLLFGWLNSWHDIRSVMGPIRMDSRRLTEIPEVSDLRIEQIVPERRVSPNPERDATLPPNLKQAPDIEDVLGMYIPSESRVCLTMRSNQGDDVNMEMSPHAAMKLLAYLAMAHKTRGWVIPDRL